MRHMGQQSGLSIWYMPYYRENNNESEAFGAIESMIELSSPSSEAQSKLPGLVNVPSYA